jgi:hypothetical protein
MSKYFFSNFILTKIDNGVRFSLINVSMLKDKNLFTFRHLASAVVLIVLVALFFTDNILYWLLGILLTQFYILSSQRLHNLVDKIILQKTPLTFSHQIFSMSLLSVLGFSFCLGFFSITEYLSPAKVKTSNSVAGVLENRYKQTKIEPKTIELANQLPVANEVQQNTDIIANSETNTPSEVQSTIKDQVTNQKTLTQTITSGNQGNSEVTQDKSFLMVAKPTQPSPTTSKKPSQSLAKPKNSTDYKAKLAYDKNKDGKISCKDFSKNIKDENILKIFPSLDPDKNGIGCE